MNRTKHILLLLITVQLLCLPACKRAEPEDKPAERLQNWMDYYELSAGDFNAKDTFDRAYRVSHEFSLNDGDLYAPLYIYSEDSTRAIDIDSYHLVLEKRDNGELFSPGREADMEAALIDLERGVRERLLFCGPSCIFEEAGFQADGQIFIAGFAESDNDYFPVIWHIHKENGFIVAEMATERALPAENIRYISDRRLERVIFWHESSELPKGLDVPL